MASSNPAPVVRACAILCLLAAPAAAAIYMDIAPRFEGPDGQDTFGAAIGQTDTLKVWIWSDEPGVRIRDIQFDLIGTVYTSTDPNANWFEILSLGTTDPGNAFDLFALPGTLAADGSSITGVAMAALPLSGSLVELPQGPNGALLLYENFTGRPHVFAGGVVATNIVVRDENFQTVPVISYGWYQSPSPGPIAMIACVGACVARRRRVPS